MRVNISPAINITREVEVDCSISRGDLEPEAIERTYREVRVRTPWRGRARFLIASVKRLENLGLLTESEARRALARLSKYFG